MTMHSVLGCAVDLKIGGSYVLKGRVTHRAMERVSGAPPRKLIQSNPHMPLRSASALHAVSACAYAVSDCTACGCVRGAHCSRAPCRGVSRGTVYIGAVNGTAYVRGAHCSRAPCLGASRGTGFSLTVLWQRPRHGLTYMITLLTVR